MSFPNSLLTLSVQPTCRAPPPHYTPISAHIWVFLFVIYCVKTLRSSQSHRSYTWVSCSYPGTVQCSSHAGLSASLSARWVTAVRLNLFFWLHGAECQSGPAVPSAVGPCTVLHLHHLSPLLSQLACSLVIFPHSSVSKVVLFYVSTFKSKHTYQKLFSIIFVL